MSATQHADTIVARLTREASNLLRTRDPNTWQSANGRFVARKHRAHPRLWTMTDTRNGRVYSTRCDSLIGHWREIRQTVNFEAQCFAEGERPASMPL